MVIKIKKSTKEISPTKKTLTGLGMLSVFSSILFFTSNITGNVILENAKTTQITGIVLFAIGLGLLTIRKKF
jgi:hypothetical protein